MSIGCMSSPTARSNPRLVRVGDPFGSLLVNSKRAVTPSLDQTQPRCCPPEEGYLR